MNYRERLREMINRHDHELVKTCHHVLDSPKFSTVAGGITKHHKEPGGLLRHTYEVASFAMISLKGGMGGIGEILLTAAIWHDYGKCWDYEQDSATTFKATPHWHLIHHVARSYHEFMRRSEGIDEVLRDMVGHCILSHHGRREWGSPVEPQTTEALLLHQADMMSVIQDRKR